MLLMLSVLLTLHYTGYINHLPRFLAPSIDATSLPPHLWKSSISGFGKIKHILEKLYNTLRFCSCV